jgi:HSP20 family protein
MPCDPLRDLRAWQDRLERLASDHTQGWAPPIDVYETAEHYVVMAELPGLTREEVELAMDDNRLTIRGARSSRGPDDETRRYHQVERGHGGFERTFAFADPIRADGITADLRDGVLTITLPKTAPPPPLRIAVE